MPFRFNGASKSILCQEDEYLLELVRYIHLNPVRAGAVKSLGKLDLWWSETKRRWLGRCFWRNWPGISVYPGLQSRKPSSEVKNLQKRMMLNY
jgi:hypothetical protein